MNWVERYANLRGLNVGQNAEIILQGLSNNESAFGKRYCPCKVNKTTDTICPCKEMREKSDCCCGLFEKKPTVRVTFSIGSLGGESFACYLDGTVKSKEPTEITFAAGVGVCVIDAEATVAGIEDDDEKKREFIRCAMHEFGHALEDYFGLSYDEDEIEKDASTTSA